MLYDEIEQEIEKMQSSNPKLREESIDSLLRISQGIGKPYTVQYLIPFIKTILDTNEEAKIPILQQIEKIVKEVLNEIKPVYVLYREIFLTRSDLIREQASASLISSLNVKKIDYEIFGIEEFIVSLGESRFIMHRISAITVMRTLIGEIPAGTELRKLKSLFSQMQNDPLPIVRRKSILSPEIIQYFYTEQEIQKIIERVLEDTDDTVRSCFISPLFLLSKTKDNGYFNLEIFKKASKDNSWKVRSSSTKIIKEVAVYLYAIKSTHTGISILDCIDRLVEDREEAVRKSIIERAPDILAEAPDTKNKILYIIDKASCDVSSEVREIVPEVLSKISEIITKEDVELYISPIVRRLLTDEDQKTKMETIGKLKTLYNKLGAAAITDALTPVINDLESSNWRTRTAVLKSISSLSRQMDKMYFQDYLKQPFFKMFIDPIWNVRKEAAVILGEISINFGAAWVCGDMLESLEFLKESSHYAHRISYATAIGKVLQTLWPRKVQKMLAKGLLQLSQDPIPQVRMTVAKMVSQGILEEKKEILLRMQTDSHPEVISASKV
ncbi:serine/threonine-protein phosphatase 2A regulatory subunit A [Nematocida minor]|uniref:serine/threonine-protein phosphatase 2A regulatory subunit A n=1 Tax=Nematocida minor TaxID=1912983 RepID=UPI00221ED6D9|nr:serine/threonine-protein phosphatase 2A regulatory subunit A [Nematocida minor]KAI5190674.1 serine/threonine-protein phosphatase 2A regulatory subunit A [Nematocida minor]